MKGFTLSAIRAHGPSAYEVVLTSENDEVTFTMEVSGGEIEVVSWGRDFDRFVNLDTDAAGPIFQTVLDFHRARRVQLPRTDS